MALADMLPTLDDGALVNLRANAVRILAGPQDKRYSEAETLLPRIEAEIATRADAKPKVAAKPKVVRAKKPQPDADES